MKHYIVKSKTQKHTFNVEEFESAFELVQTNKSRPVTPQWKDDSLEKDGVSKSFNGVSTIGEAYDLLETGWTQGLEEMNMAIGNAKTIAAHKRVAFKNDVVGFAPIVPLAMMNVPHSMINTALKSVKSKVIKIMYNMGDSCGTTTEQFFNRGKKVMETVVALERSGYRCELYSAQSYSNGETSDFLLVKVKEANQPLDVKRVMFPFTHPAMFRVIGFEWEDKCPSAIYRIGRGRPLHKSITNAPTAIKEAFGDEYVYLDASIENKSKEEIEKVMKGEQK